MTIEEKVREIMLSEELSDSEKLDRLHALIPPDVFKIDNLNQATPAQLKQLEDGLSNYRSNATDQASNSGLASSTAWVDMMGYLSGRSQRFLHRLVGKFVVRTLSSVDVWSSRSLLSSSSLRQSYLLPTHPGP